MPQKQKKRHENRAVFFDYFRLFVNKTKLAPATARRDINKNPFRMPTESDTTPIISGATVLPTEPEELIIPETAPECSGCLWVANATNPDQSGAQAKPIRKQNAMDT